MFHLGVANVDLDVAYICMCFKCFHTYIESAFHLDVTMFVMDKHVFSSFFWCFASVLDICCRCFSYFRRMLQMFHLNIAKVDRMLHMLNGTHLAQSPTAAARASSSGHRKMRAGVGPTRWAHEKIDGVGSFSRAWASSDASALDRTSRR